MTSNPSKSLELTFWFSIVQDLLADQYDRKFI